MLTKQKICPRENEEDERRKPLVVVRSKPLKKLEMKVQCTRLSNFNSDSYMMFFSLLEDVQLASLHVPETVDAELLRAQSTIERLTKKYLVRSISVHCL